MPINRRILMAGQVRESKPLSPIAGAVPGVHINTESNLLADAAKIAAGIGLKFNVQAGRAATSASAYVPLAQNVGPRNLTLEKNQDGKARISLNYPEIENLVLSGGGAKGAAYPGAVVALEAQGVMSKIRSISGSSAGAITAALLASGISSEHFTKLSNSVDFVDLLRQRAGPPAFQIGRHVVEEILRDTSKRIGEKTGIGKNVGDTLTILMNAQTRAPALENLIREESRASVMAHLSGLDLKKCGEQKAAIEAIRFRLEAGGAVTFGDLHTLSPHIPAIKELSCTGTMMEKNRPQIAIFSAETTPEMDIAKAALISSSLPFVFAQQTHSSAFGTARYQDGGIMFNVPAPALVNHESASRALPHPDALILMFSAVPDKPIAPSGLSDVIADWLTSAPMSALNSLQMRGLGDLREQIVQVPLKNERGDFSGLMSGTLNFGMSIDDKRAMQRDLQSKVEEHIALRGQQKITMEFLSTDAAMLALADSEFHTLHDDHPHLTANLHRFRTRANEMLGDLSNSIAGMERLAPDRLALLVQRLDELTEGDADRATYLARKMLDPQQPKSLARITDAIRGAETNSPTLRAVQALNEKQDTVNASRRAISDIIYRARFKYGQTAANHALLNLTEDRLNKASTRKEYNEALSNLAANYKPRISVLSESISSKTIDDAKAYRILDRRV
ncbi:patatin-like phospholipase family protein [Burkholderia thailandensis MSMB121]|uniref:patatin-like phospholipase family protein n=1 Tax=Burkholderia humptydooensis TaxID=430531 RepID=UPI000328014A|nr:patatin-like phospholipase family protein [Burkholderia humptydooensis]AGK51166.1 patatin-like phospholipase family protein [Burkholderia thailandensis MSMB121]ATF32189.1 type three secretion system effector protein [Burkholderia thailandensis]